VFENTDINVLGGNMNGYGVRAQLIDEDDSLTA
jgi:hypothetical protein